MELLEIQEFSWPFILANFKVKYRIRSTGVIQALCSFHQEKSPSFFIWPDSQKAFCFGCHWQGSIYRFVHEFEHFLTYEEIKEYCSRRYVPQSQLEFSFY